MNQSPDKYYDSSTEEIKNKLDRKRELDKLRTRRYRARKANQIKARSALGAAIRRGRMAPEPCKICQDPETEGHHSDYSKSLDVIWLCKKHHAEWHFMFKAKNT